MSPTVITFGIFAILYGIFLINAAKWHYGFIDDQMGYLVFPERILTEGCLGRDPFDFRRVEDSPVTARRPPRPDGTDLGRRVVADRYDDIERRGTGPRELVPALASKALGREMV